MRSFVERLAFSSAWIALAAGALCAAASIALGLEWRPSVVALAACGTFVVYSIDRLRDLERDRATAPRRSAFVAKHARALTVATAAAALVSAGLAWTAGRTIVLGLAPVLVLGLMHRRLKRFAAWKALYITVAWTGVTVGMPLALADGSTSAVPVAVIVASSVFANAIVSNLRDGEAVTSRFGERVPRRLAVGFAALACGVAGMASLPVRALAPVPLLTLVAILAFRDDEAYGLVVVDGALLVGGIVAVILNG